MAILECLKALRDLDDLLEADAAVMEGLPCGLAGPPGPAGAVPCEEACVHPVADAPAAETRPEAPKYTKEQVREALANARLKGVPVTGLIHSVGADNLSGVAPERYGELMESLQKALEDLG